MDELYKKCDLDAIVNSLLKQVVSQAKYSAPTASRNGLVNRVADILAYYRKNREESSHPGQMLLPDRFLLMPLYTNSLLNSDAVSGGQEMTVDDRVYHMMAVMSMDVGASQRYLYPRIATILDPTRLRPVSNLFFLIFWGRLGTKIYPNVD